LTHAATWLNPTNIALSVHSEKPPLPLSAILTGERTLYLWQFQPKICYGIVAAEVFLLSRK